MPVDAVSLVQPIVAVVSVTSTTIELGFTDTAKATGSVVKRSAKTIAMKNLLNFLLVCFFIFLLICFCFDLSYFYTKSIIPHCTFVQWVPLTVRVCWCVFCALLVDYVQQI